MIKIRVVLFFSILISVFLITSAIIILVVSKSTNTVNKAENKTQAGTRTSDSRQLSEKEIFERIKDGVQEGEGLLLLESARKISKKTEIITLSNCNPDVLVPQAQLGGSISFKNSDTSDHTIKISTRNFQVKAGGQQTIKTDFVKGSGIYSYFCDNSRTPSGIIIVLSKTP